jgi:non-canonical (house-cleaning) NTP pyrophosphatase
MSIIIIAIGTTNPCKVKAVQVAFEEAMYCSVHPSVENAEEGQVRLVFAPYHVSSGVPPQPFGDLETKAGARNRAIEAHRLCIIEHGSCDFAVGIEGGVEVMGDDNDDDDTNNTVGGGGTTATRDNGNSNKEGSHCPNFKKSLWCMAWMAILGSRNNGHCLVFCQSRTNTCYDVLDIHSKVNRDESNHMCWGYAKTGTFELPPKISDLVQNQGLELGHADDLVFQRVNSKQESGTVGILTNFMINRSEYYVHALKLALIPWIWPDLYWVEPQVSPSQTTS